jgi:hypothetical protein
VLYIEILEYSANDSLYLSENTVAGKRAGKAFTSFIFDNILSPWLGFSSAA